MSFFDEVQKSWNDGVKVVIRGDNGNDIPIQKGINYIKNKAKKYEDAEKNNALVEKNNQKETEGFEVK